MTNEKIGFIGQGFIGKNYADDFERRGFDVVRYALEAPYHNNLSEIKKCGIVFIAVPTPTRPEGFDDSIIRSVIKNLSSGSTAVIKSTIIPGATESIQAENSDILVLHSPEFLAEKTATYDAANPTRNIIGVPKMNDEYLGKAKLVMQILPRAPFEKICLSRESEVIKYANNLFLYFKVMFANIFHDFAEKNNCDWNTIKAAIGNDPRIGTSHLNIVDKSGRGAGGNCFIKDMSAFFNEYKNIVDDDFGVKILEMMQKKNISLLIDSQKDLDLLRGVYGDKVFSSNHKII